jgi:tetratricopeptide (TPR) repeat protein
MTNPEQPVTDAPAPQGAAATPADNPASTAIQPADAAPARPDSPASTDIQPAEGVAAPATAPAEPKPLPKVKTYSLEALRREARPFDRVGVALLLVLAFFLGAFAIHNADFWMHLATGRLIAQGEYRFGVDPFAHTTEGVEWVNHAWLFDLLLYGIYSVAGEAGVVVFKALLVVALAVVMLSIRRPGQGVWIPVVCTTLALVALSPRLLMQPTVVSFLFLALTLYLLHRGFNENAPRALWLLPPLFVLWVNMDAWFVLGPLTVALFLIVTALQPRGATAGGAEPDSPGEPGASAPGASKVKLAALVLLAGVLACFVNPHLHRAFQLPLDLGQLVAPTGLLPADMVASSTAFDKITPYVQVFRGASPLAEAYWSSPAVGLNVAGVAYYPLLLLSLVSFVLCAGPRGSGQGFPLGFFFIWLPLAVLSVLNMRWIAFFAVVAGPIAALNWQAFARQRLGAQTEVSRRTRAWMRLGRAATVLGGLALVLLAWPGWLHDGADEARRTRHVAFHAAPDPLLKKAGSRLDELHQRGVLKRGFNYSGDAANYFAWFAGPQVKSFFDNRLALFPEVAEAFGKLRKELRDEAAALYGGPPPKTKGLQELQKAFRLHGINYLVLTGMPQDEDALRIANRLWLEPRRWVPLHEDGRTSVFGWRDPQLAVDVNPFEKEAVDVMRLAFGPVAAEDQSPAGGAEPVAGPIGFWEGYLWGPQPPGPSLGAASLYGGRHELAMQRIKGGPSPALALLALRYARRAVAENPHDAAAYQHLARAVTYLWKHHEQMMDPRTSPLASPLALLARQMFRHVEYAGALKQAVLLRPDDPDSHQQLGELFLQMEYYDAALEHLEKAYQSFRRLQPRAGLEDLFEKQRAAMEQNVAALSDEVNRRREDHLVQVQAASVRAPFERSRMALMAPTRVPGAKDKDQRGPRGLALLALKELREAKVDSLPKEEQHVVADLQLRLLLTLGEVREAYLSAFAPEAGRHLRPLLEGGYDVCEALTAAGLGNYEQARRALEDLEAGLERVMPIAQAHKDLQKWQKKLEVELFPTRWQFFPTSPLVGYLDVIWTTRLTVSRRLIQAKIVDLGKALMVCRDAAELRSLRGLMALEQGDTDTAYALFAECERLALAGLDYANRPIVRIYLSFLEQQRGKGKG